MRRSLPALFLPLLAVTCSVDRSVLDEQYFDCRSDDDCIDGYGCELVNATGDGFCAPRVDEARACDGFRTVDGLCLAECVPGSAAACESGLECHSTDIVAGEAGYCVPETSCSSDADCGADEACLSTAIHDIIGLFGQIDLGAVAELSCVRRCADDPDLCPTGTECLVGYCMPRCGDDSECPLGFGCAEAVAGTSVGFCFPGVPWLLTGIKCRDQSNCLLGTCTAFPVAGTNDTVNYCVMPCDASVPDPPCSPDRVIDGRLNIYTCGQIPNVGSQCFFLGGYMGICDPANNSGDCVSGLECRRVTVSTGQEYDLCVEDCTYDPAAPNLDGAGTCTDEAFCLRVDPGSDAGICIYDMPEGSICQFGEQCASGSCDMAASCDQDEGLGCCAPAT